VTRHAAETRRRKRSCRIGLTLHPAEAETIEALARSVGMSVASYHRAVGAGYQPRAIVDRDQVEAMLRINGDLGRLGGLLKLWLSDDAKLDQFDRGEIQQVHPGRASAYRREPGRAAFGRAPSPARPRRAMIAKEIAAPRTSGSFRDLVSYLTKSQGKEERVGTVRLSNCVSSDAESAILEVENTQTRNHRARQTTYHLMLAFPPGEEPSAKALEGSNGGRAKRSASLTING
jgi:hypothetical protein